jgi:Na+/H+-dicarboxylate symporter
MYFLRKTPIQLLLAVFSAYLFLPFLSTTVISVFFTFSQLLKEFLMLVLPFIVFFYLSSALLSFQKSAPMLVLAVILLIIFSNAAAVLMVYGFLNLFIDHLCTPFNGSFALSETEIQALWEMPFKKLVSTEWGMISAIFLSLILGFLKGSGKKYIIHGIERGKNLATSFLRSCFVPLLPFYVFGYVLKLLHDGSLTLLIHHYGKIFFICLTLIAVYTFLFYLLANKGNLKKTVRSLSTMLPAALTGFSTMSSAASMPITLQATQKNLKEEGAPSSYSQFIIPFTTNIHLIGDGISLSLTALTLLYMSGTPLPDFESYLIFTFWYCLAKFSTAAVPGAGVLIILPVMQNYLHLSPELNSVLATIYILKDGLLTATNIMGNGGFALLSYNLFKNIFFKKP